MLKIAMLVPLAMLATTAVAAAQARGSYQETCDNIQQRGPYLSAECQDVNGDSRRTSIDLRGCRGGVANTNGRLTCSRGYSYRGDGYDEPQPRRYYVPQPNGDDEDNSD
jgi:hypothetical protein